MDKLYIINSLATLEKIKYGQKIAVHHDKISIIESPYRIIRWISGNNKHVTHVHISEIINNAISMNVPIKLKIVNSLEQLKLTYRRHKKFVKGMTDLQYRIIEADNNSPIKYIVKLLAAQQNK